MGACFLYGNGGSNRYRVSEVYGGQNPPNTGVKDYDIFLRTNVAITSGEISTNIGGLPTWDTEDGAFYVTLVAGAFNDTRSSAYFVLDTQKNHNISGFPGSAYVRENGKWRRCEGYVFHSNKWVQFSSAWDGTLFYNGNQYADVTGGWTGADSYSPNLKKTSDNLIANVDISTVNMIDLTAFNTLYFIGNGYGSNSGGHYNATAGVRNSSGWVASVSFQNNKTYSVDVSGLTGSYYVRFLASGSRGQYICISKVWLV